MRVLSCCCQKCACTVASKLITGFNIITDVVPGDPLPCNAPLLRNGLDMPVALGITRKGIDGRFMRWNNHLRVRLSALYCLRYRLAIMGAVTDESLEWRGYLGQQIRHGCGVAQVRRGEFTCQNRMLFIDGKMQFAPSAPGRNTMLSWCHSSLL